MIEELLTHWKNEVKGLTNNQDAQNEYYRQFPRHEQHAFRDEAVNSLFNLNKLYHQIDYNEEHKNRGRVTVGNFQWHDGRIDTKCCVLP